MTRERGHSTWYSREKDSRPDRVGMDSGRMMGGGGVALGPTPSGWIAVIWSSCVMRSKGTRQARRLSLYGSEFARLVCRASSSRDSSL